MATVQELIKDRLPITDVLSSYLTLIPAGKQFKAKCPFHNERTASFSISPDRGVYYCFGCGAKGDIFTFVQQFEGTDFNGALKILAERAGVALTKRDHKSDNLEPIYEWLEKTTLRYQNELQKNNEALLYLRRRGITDETISQFRLGYAPAEWRFVANTCTTGELQTTAIRAGLIKKPDTAESSKKQSETSPYDRFRGRIMFPLTDSSGRVVAFSGRMFPDTEEGPKYLNSPETEIFQKSRVLYGFDKAKFHIKRHNFAILVEGQMDLLMSHQAGFRNTIATSGTAVSEQSVDDTHANLVVLSRLTPHLFLAFDGDGAGQRALNRAAMVALSLGMNPKVVPVPQGTDPADFLQNEGTEKWKELLKQSKHFIMHQVSTIQIHDTSPHMVVRILRENVFPFLARVISPIEQNLYIEAIGKELGIETTEVARELAAFVSTQPMVKAIEARESKKETEVITARERFAAFLERYPDYKEEYIEKLKALSFENHTYGVVELSPQHLPELIAVIERDYGTLTDEDRSIVAAELYQKAVDEFFSRIQQQLARDLREAESKEEGEQAESLLKLLAKLNQLRHGT